jgi:Concanavalin A-like lectin/glucanases superfamily/Peptidase_C39 like family
MIKYLTVFHTLKSTLLLFALFYILTLITPLNVLAQTPISWWKAESNTIDYFSINNAVEHGDIVYENGIQGKAFKFDGVGDYIAVPFNQSYNFEASSDFSIDLCVNPSTTSGAYRAIVVKSPTSSHWDWGIYMNPDNTIMSGLDNQHLLNSDTKSIPDEWTRVTVTYNNGIWNLYINGDLEDSHIGTLITQSTGGLGFGIKGEDTINADYFSGLIDEIKLYDYELASTQISETCNSTLAVPDIKQDTLPWGDDLYDTANLWNPVPTNTTIGRWGCALTSGTMILQYNGYNFNPDVMNQWFNASGKGYTPNGGVKWASFSRLTKERQDLGNPKLEFKYKGNSLSVLDEELENGRPAILKYGKINSKGEAVNHFVVATAKQGNDYLVNDPDSNTNITKSQVEASWGMTLQNVLTYTPSQTDISYMVLAVDEGFDVQLLNDQGIIVDGDYILESPIASADDKDTASGNGKSYQTLYVPKPASGNYSIKVLGNGEYTLFADIYDTEGRTKDFKFEGETSNQDIYELNFDKTNSEQAQIEEPEESISFDSLLQDIDIAYQNGGIKKKSTYTAIRAIVVLSKYQYSHNYKILSKFTLRLAKEAIIKSTPKLISTQTSTMLVTNINTLLELLW